MKRLIFYLFFSQIVIYNPASAQQFSDKGFYLFWESMEKIENLNEISILDLDQLWKSPGYSSWMGTERGQNIFFNYFTLVNNPQLQDSLKNEMERSKGYRTTLFNHQLEAQKKQGELREFTKKLVDSDIIEKAKKQAFTYLPDTLSVENDNTIIALMIFQPDAFAIPEDNVILLDVLYALNYGKGFEKFLGHEIFHIYSAKYLSRLKPVDYQNDALVWSIDKLRNEGIADLIDKENIFEKVHKSEYDLNYIEHFQNSKQHLATIDSLVQEIAKDNSKLNGLGKKVRGQLPFGGHPTGLYIAKIIKNERGGNALLDCLESPFTFLFLYNEIAKESEGDFHVFSKESIKYLKKLEINTLSKSG